MKMKISIAFIAGLTLFGSLTIDSTNAVKARSSSRVKQAAIKNVITTSMAPAPNNVVAKVTTRASEVKSISAKVNEDGASIPNEVFNLVKCIMGAGVFTLPAGIATFTNSPTGLVPASALLMFVGLLSSYCFSLIGRVCAYTGATTYKEAWSKSVGEGTSWIPNVSSLFTTMQAIVSYSIVLADTVPQLFGAAGITGVTRTQSLLSVTTLILLPLCMKKTLSALAPFSLVGLCGLAYTAVAMIIRYKDGSYSPGGFFYDQIDVKPKLGNAINILTPAVFILASRVSNAFVAHYNAPKLYYELRKNTIPRYQRMVGTSYIIVCFAYVLISGVGFLTFGEGSASFILSNYATKDPLLSFSRIAIFVSMVFSYPLVFVGFRDNILDAFAIEQDKRTDKLMNTTTFLLLAIITTSAFFLKDIGTLLSFGGATYANWLTFLYPTYMFLQCAKWMPLLRQEVPFVIFTMLMGVGMSAIGTKEFLKKYL